MEEKTVVSIMAIVLILAIVLAVVCAITDAINKRAVCYEMGYAAHILGPDRGIYCVIYGFEPEIIRLSDE